MSNFPRINTFANKFSDNMLPVTSVFDDNTVLNVTSGSGTCNFVRDREYGSFANMSVTSYNSTAFNFNFGDALKTVVDFDGNYFFQLSFFNFNTTPEFFVPFEFYVDVYKDGVLSETIAGQMVSNPTVNSEKTITFAQNIVCNAIDELDFAFRIGEDITYPFTNITFSIGNFKLEHNNKFLSAPTPYSLPVNYFVNTYTGWGYYVDSLATPTITIGTTYTQITIDALGANITDYLPKDIRGISHLWSGSKITPVAIGDDYDGRFDVTITAKSGTPTLIELIIDISGGVAGTNKAFTGYIQTGGTIPYSQSIDLDYFSLGTFLANGGKLFAKVDSGTITIGRRNIKITRKSKAFL
jgi:hypothetical protein